MSIEKDRLLSLIEFVQQSARLRSKPAPAVSSHGLFSLFEHQIQGLPGIGINATDTEGEKEIWLSVERLHELPPPEVSNTLLRPWVLISQNPTEEPKLREATHGSNLIAAGTHCSYEDQSGSLLPPVDPEATISVEDYENVNRVKAELKSYIDMSWRTWAEEEILRRKTIRLYSELFTLKQQLEGGIVEAQLELVWGVGMGMWKYGTTTISYPLLGRLVEMSLNPETAELEISPRDVDPRLEVDWYASVDNPGVVELEKAAKDFFEKATTTFSPFDPSTFEPLLRRAATNLDANGVYYPNENPAYDRYLPKPDDKLKVTDTWVLFARPRTNSIFLQDLDRLKSQAKEAEFYPPAVAAVVTNPDIGNPIIELPSFRGVSDSHQGASTTSTGEKPRDLFFPKPFNDEQVRIIQLLDVSDGVVVQGPPGTGKTHTIANVICHYLAEGKRVLVTSMKDPALAVLQRQLPAEIRPLAISLLTSEQEGLKQFEHSINKIASEVQGIDRAGTARAISHMEDSIDSLHGRLATIDNKIAHWAKLNLDKLILETEEIDPQDAAREVIENIGQFDFIPDALGISPDFAAQFTDADVLQLRDARKALGEDINYLGTSLPQLVEFPDSLALLQVHQDLSQFDKLQKDVDSGTVPGLADSRQETIELAQQLLIHIESMQRLRSEVAEANQAWTGPMRDHLKRSAEDDLLRLLDSLGSELQDLVERRKVFLKEPVSVPVGAERNPEIAKAVLNLANSKSAFGVKGFFGKSQEKSLIDNIRVLGQPPASPESWRHVSQYFDLSHCLHAAALRWNALANELPIGSVEEDTLEGGMQAAKSYALYLKLQTLIKAEIEVCSEASDVFPNWPHSGEAADNIELLCELEKAVRHHLTKSRLANVWANKERCQKVLNGRTGPVIEKILDFFSQSLGSPNVTDAEMQSMWSELMAELSRVLGFGSDLTVVNTICETIETSGAPLFAELLRTTVAHTVDDLLPDTWRKAWRLRRLATHLESIDARQELKKLAKTRYEIEKDLSSAYRDIVVKRSWLKLAENASPSIRAALQSYLAAIQKIGRGTGKRAVRYRQDARTAASLASPAVPCWIMAHYRVSESLPAELGCFDLVVIDEASQSDLTALPSLLRAQKVLIVGDDKQVSPEGVGLEEEKVRSLMNRFLGSQVVTYRPQMSPERSIYDLFKVVFARSGVMLKEHFRCVGPIIEYSKREFYNHELQPLRVPKASERLDPPLIDVLIEDGYRKGDLNLPEARFIVDEIKAIVADPKMLGRSIGVVSLLADKQARLIWDRLTDELGPELIEKHSIACGDARTFQGKERDIMFLSMVSAPNEVGAPLSRDTFAQRFNVAASRARDRMYLVRSVGLEHLSDADRFRRSLIKHFATPYAQDELRVEDLRKLCESPFEREMYDELTQRGYWVTPQVPVGQFRIDMVVEGHNDARLAIECDGDKYHTADKWADDMQRERILERAGWRFWRCFASAFIRRRSEVLEDLLKTLTEHGIVPTGSEGAPQSVHTERRIVTSIAEPPPDLTEVPDDEGSVTPDVTDSSGASSTDGQDTKNQPFSEPQAGDLFGQIPSFAPPVILKGSKFTFDDYQAYDGPPGVDPRTRGPIEVSEGIVRIIHVEGPVVAKRVYDSYLRSCGIKRMSHGLKSLMNKALSHAIRHGQVVSENESGKSGLLFSVVRINGTSLIRPRLCGPRSLDEIPPSELQVLARRLAERDAYLPGSEEHLRAVLEALGMKRLTTQVLAALQENLQRCFPYVDQFLSETSEERV